MKIKYKTRNLSDPKEWVPNKTYLGARNRKGNPLQWGNQTFLFRGWKNGLAMFNLPPSNEPHIDWNTDNLVAIPNNLSNYTYTKA